MWCMWQSLFFCSNFENIHQRMPTVEKLFKCDLCDEIFSRVYNSKTHQRLHTGEKALKFVMCKKNFSHWSNFYKHQRVHARVLEACKLTSWILIDSWSLFSQIIWSNYHLITFFFVFSFSFVIHHHPLKLVVQICLIVTNFIQRNKSQTLSKTEMHNNQIFEASQNLPKKTWM